MFRASVRTVFFIFIANSLLRETFAQCETCSWIKYNQALCPCDPTVPTACNFISGTCSPVCDEGHFGPDCLYASVSYTATDGTISLGWLTDNSDTTCNDGTSQTITVTLDKPTLLTWMRLSFDDTAQKSAIQVSYTTPSASTSTPCPVGQTATVDLTTLDIYCPTSDAVSELTLAGSGVEGLCSLKISGGHNIAYGENDNTRQSSTFKYFYASNAVDGRIPTDSGAEYCTHTAFGTQEDSSPLWWTLTFPGLVNVNDIEIYTRPRGNQHRLIGFTLNFYDMADNVIFTYTDPNLGSLNYKSIYFISGIASDVKMIEVVLPNTAVEDLTICEVIVYGESAAGCNFGSYGLDCENHCNCADGGDCFDHSGGCPSGCAAGYTGEDCYTPCSQGTYGVDCRESCSVYCDGDDHLCNGTDGTCDLGCEAGYLLPLCKEGM